MTHPQFKVEQVSAYFTPEQRTKIGVPAAWLITNADMVVTQGGTEKPADEIVQDTSLMPFYGVTRSYMEGIAGLLTYWYERGHEDGYETGYDEGFEDNDQDPEPPAWLEARYDRG